MDAEKKIKRLNAHIQSAFVLLFAKFEKGESDFATQTEHDQWHKSHAMRELKEALGMDGLTDSEASEAIEENFLNGEISLR